MGKNEYFCLIYSIFFWSTFFFFSLVSFGSVSVLICICIVTLFWEGIRSFFFLSFLLHLYAYYYIHSLDHIPGSDGVLGRQ